ncbi:oxygen-insensitive NADPH nitroreductase [Endozoicomonadaceae bacterium StTr2]
MNDVVKLMKAHRSIRKFTNQAVDDNLVRELIEAGQCAATSSYLQGVNVIRVRNIQTREKIAELAGDQSYVASAPTFLVFCADLNRSGQCCEKHGHRAVEGMTEHFIIATVDVALMAQNVALAAESKGLGICYIGGIRNNPQEVSELLQLPRMVYPVFGLCLGYPDQDPLPKPRLPVDMVLMEETYQHDRDNKQLDDYDQIIRQYYEQRTGGKLSQTWSEQMNKLLGKESRPHMKEFLRKRGFEMR